MLNILGLLSYRFKKYEYRIESFLFRFGKNTEQLRKDMDNFGKDGWRINSILGDYKDVLDEVETIIIWEREI